jgi:hypothetical protein
MKPGFKLLSTAQQSRSSRPAVATPECVLALCPRLEPGLAHLLEQLCHSGREVKQLLATDPGPELMVVLDVLEPVGAGKYKAKK